MCGIAGIVTPLAQWADAGTVRLMTDQMAHRGPDAAAVFVDGPVALGHRRLSIIDLADIANQPMTDHSGRYVVVFNGEIYNYRSLKAKLSEYPYRTHSDTEVILAAYSRWGSSCLQELNGMFAFAIWDCQQQSLFMARDRVGKKPLYYTQRQGTFMFASELRALLATNQVPRTLSQAGLTMYLKYQSVPAPDTLIEGVYQLPAGHYALLSQGELRVQAYWSMLSPTTQFDVSGRQVVEREVYRRLRSAVAARMVSDVPLGAFLSGGIDSSAIVGLMAALSDQPINTFSIGFQEAEFDESAYSAQIARRFNTRHTRLELTANRLADALPTVLSRMDTPSGDGPNTFMVSGLARQMGIKVALTGVGGDELFAGYPSFARYARLRQFELFWHLPQPIRVSMVELLRRAVSERQSSKLTDLVSLAAFDPAYVLPLFRQIMSGRLIGQLSSGFSTSTDTLVDWLHSMRAGLTTLHPLSQASVGEIRTYAEPLLLRDADQMGMAHSLEVRVPFFDYELIEYVLQVPDPFKTGNSSPKPLLVRSLGELLPDAIVNRPKMGFSFPWARWLRGPLRPFCQYRLEGLARRDLFQPSVLMDFWHQFLVGAPAASWNHIWLLVVLEEWLDNNGF